MLSLDELLVADALAEKHNRRWARYETLEKYHDGSQRLATLGLAVPPNLDSLETVVNWPRVAVEAIVERSDVKALRRTGELEADKELLALFEANNMAAQIPLFVRDKLIYGRAFLSVGVNERDKDMPLIMAESPRELSVDIDRRTRKIKSAMRLVRGRTHDVVEATLYLPDATIWLSRDDHGRWVETDRDQHNLGTVPIVMSLNRQRTGDWHGRSEMNDVIRLADAAARTLTNMQYAVEAAAVPRKYAIGVSPEDFQDSNGNQLPQWEAYLGSVWAVADDKAKIGQLNGADLSGFHATVDMYGKLAASVTGYPASYFGHTAANPASAEAIKGEEARLVKTVERSNAEAGTAIGWAFDLAERFRTGEWPVKNRVVVDWHDAGTPTFAQKADALQKLSGGRALLSREGVWDELGWSEARKERERAFFAQEEADTFFGELMEKFDGVDSRTANVGDPAL